MLSFALAVAAALQPAASPASATPVVPGPEALGRMCSAQGALGYAFAEPGAPFASKLENMLGLSLRLPAEMRPFERATLSATPWSDRLAFVEYSIEMPTGGEALVEALADAADEAGWQPRPDLEDILRVPMSLTPLAGGYAFAVPDSGDVVAGFKEAFGTVTFACGHVPTMVQRANEAFGELPPGTARPQPPVLPAASPHGPEACDRPDVQRDMLAVLDGRASSHMTRLLSVATYYERLTQWKSWRLTSSGKVTSQRILALTVRAVESGAGRADPLAGMALIPEMMEVLRSIGSEAQAQQPAAACRAAFRLAGIFTRMEAITGPQWQALNAALDEEARRVGLSFD